MPVIVRVKTANQTVQRYLKTIPKQLASKSRSDLNQCLTNHLAYNLFTKIEKAFIDKSSGGADELGQYWKPLDPKTIAARPLTEKEEKRYADRSEKGLLTPGELRIWKGIFASQYAKHRKSMNDARAKYLAAKSAWAILKSKGAKTRIGLLSRRKVPILRISDRLLESVSAGTLSGNRYYKPKEQIFRNEDGTLLLGSGVPYAEHVNKARRIIPSKTAMIRGGWIRDALKKSSVGVAEVLATKLSKMNRS